MVQIMTSGHKVKVEDDDSFYDQHYFSPKRPKLHFSPQKCNLEPVRFSAPPTLCNPLRDLEEPPLGLRLKKTPSFLDLLQTKLVQQDTKPTKLKKKDRKPNSVSTDKLKASNFPASLIQIGTWEYKSKYEGDLVAKFYFAKHKLVWEMLEGGLKNKIEIQWSDIVSIKANYHEARAGTATLDVVLAKQPLFFKETNPQPRKHTLWQVTSDFTGGRASTYRRHYLECPRGPLSKHFEKLIQCDPHLKLLSQRPQIKLESPFYEPRSPTFVYPDESFYEAEPKSMDGSDAVNSSSIVEQIGFYNNFGYKTLSSSSEVCAGVIEKTHRPNEDEISLHEVQQSGSKCRSSLSRKDSFGELLLNLPRIVSLPKFLSSISEDSETKD